MASHIKDLAVRYFINCSNPIPPRELRERLRSDDRGGMSTEMVIIVGILITVAIAVVSYIGSQILNKAHGIRF